ncbi:MAG: IS1634 family transposase [Planctomycetota bacterium]|nr:MAG: IS1634 family transposase [Planctomycetota bacterium]
MAYVTDIKKTGKNGKKYISTLIRQSYREDGQVKTRTIANLSSLAKEEVDAIRFALQHKGELQELVSSGTWEITEGRSIGAVWLLRETARQLGILEALGDHRQGKLAMWQVISRILEQGSSVSSVRLAELHAGCEVLDIKKTFHEDHLYKNLAWLSKNQGEIEKKLFFKNQEKGEGPVDFFLYDVTSSYFEGQCDALADGGYNRDGEKGKKQVVIGLLCDSKGDPVSVGVFRENTSDVKTLSSQIKQIAKEFGCSRVTMVGDRGMIKSYRIEELAAHDLHYITAITKAQIRKLCNDGVIQLELFDEKLAEVEMAEEGVRYILRKDPQKAAEIQENRERKYQSMVDWVREKQKYLDAHPRAKIEVALTKGRERIEKLGLEKWVTLEVCSGKLSLKKDEETLAELSLLDGCYVLKTDLTSDTGISKEDIDARYKDLSFVEQNFRTIKTGHLEVRPFYVQTEESTRGHVFVVMLAYKILRRLKEAWKDLNITVEEGLENLKTLCVLEMKKGGKEVIYKVPKPRHLSQRLFKATSVTIPDVFLPRKFKVSTKKKFQTRCKS